MKRSVYITVLPVILIFFLFSCSKNISSESPLAGIPVETPDGGSLVLPPINIYDYAELEDILLQFTDNVSAKRDGNDLYVEVVVSKNADRCPFSMFSYKYLNGGLDGLVFDYKYDLSKELSYDIKKSIVRKYNEAENQYVLSEIKNFI